MGDTAVCSQAAKGMAKRNVLSSKPSTPPEDDGKRIIYTGPGGTGNYQPRFPDHTQYVGARTSPVEGTSEAVYLWRPAPTNPPPWFPRCCFAGEIGWGVKGFASLNQRAPFRSKLIMPEQFSPLKEFEIMSRYRDPRWKMYPAPDPRHLGWADYPNYHPPSLTMNRPETSHCQGKNREGTEKLVQSLLRDRFGHL